VTPDRVDAYCSRTELLLAIREREDVPQDIKDRIDVVLHLAAAATRYTPPVVKIEVCEEPE
jgi:hypothetical protein